MKTIRMTDRWLRSVEVAQGREEFADALVPGLRLRVSRRSKKWSVVTRVERKLRRVQLGAAPDIGLLDARQKANEILENGAEALPPDQRDPDQLSNVGRSLLDLCAGCVARMEAKNQPSAKEYERALVTSDLSFCTFMEREFARPALANEVQPGHVSSWLRSIHKSAPSHARHCRAYLHAAYEWALKAEYDYTSTSATSFRLKTNPVARRPAGQNRKLVTAYSPRRNQRKSGISSRKRRNLEQQFAFE